MEYQDILELKKHRAIKTGFDCNNLSEYNLFDFQEAIVKWALKKGKCALFEDTGLGKTAQQLVWANEVYKHTNKPVLILAPLAVSKQTKQEGLKFNVEVNLCESKEDVVNGVNITNYEKIHKFDTEVFSGVVLDESSILKSHTGATTNDLIERFAKTPYKLCCTATPSPNDYTEIGTTAEFLGIMRRSEMLAMFFINDITNGDGWRLKGHCEKEFFKWIATWAVMIKNPSDIGFDGSKYILPKLNIINEIVESENDGSCLFVPLAETLQERREARKNSIDKRISKVDEIITKNQLKNCLIWCDFNDESELLHKSIINSYEVKGSDTPEYKEYGMLGFASGKVKYLVSKPSICGFGMNWQNCNNMIFCGLSDSYEKFYQAIRRCYRFGQTKEVNVYIVISEAEENVLNNIIKKQELHNNMSKQMISIMSEIMKSELYQTKLSSYDYIPTENIKLFEF